MAIAVSDTGIGLSEEEQARLFERFFRSSRPEARKERGTGLGLALVQETARRLGGTVRVKSALGEGSTFTFWLPLRHPSAPTDGVGRAAGATPGQGAGTSGSAVPTRAEDVGSPRPSDS